MLVETKDILSLDLSTSATLLGFALTILTIVPIIYQTISDRISGHFQAAQHKRTLSNALGILIVIAGVLLFNVLILSLVLLFPALQYCAVVIGVIVLLGSVLGFSIALALGVTVVFRMT